MEQQPQILGKEQMEAYLATFQDITTELKALIAREVQLNKRCFDLNAKLQRTDQELQGIRGRKTEIQEIFNRLQELTTDNISNRELAASSSSSSMLLPNGSSNYASAIATNDTQKSQETRRCSSCSQCRKIHKGCDKTLPACKACVRKGLQCEYPLRKGGRDK